jgi:hypothetical protein
MANENTKFIATRIPLDLYIEILTDQGQKKQSINDYLLQLVYAERKSAKNPTTKFEATTTNKNEDFKKKYTELITKWNKEIPLYNKLSDDHVALKKSSATEIKELKARIAKANAYIEKNRSVFENKITF